MLEQKNFFKGNVKGVEISNELLVDIDYEYDLEKAEMIYKNRISK